MRLLVLMGTAIPVLLLALANYVTVPTKLVYNASQSAPTGFYWIEQKPVSLCDFALVRVPERAKSLFEKRGYLPPDVPLIKRVWGVTGNKICRHGRRIIVDGLTITVALLVDNLGRPLPVWQGCHVLNDDQIFLLQDHPHSFDGRYFGPLSRSLVLGRATKVLFSKKKCELF